MAMIRFWLSPFQLPADVLTTMAESGLQPWPEGEGPTPGPGCLLLYDRPDRLIAAASDPAEPAEPGVLTAQGLLDGYRRLLAWSEQAGLLLLSSGQLSLLGGQGLRSWLAAADGAGQGVAPLSTAEPLALDPLMAASMLRLVDTCPELLDAYKDLELRAELLGREPDLQYRQHLRQHSQAADQLLTSLLRNLRLVRQMPELEQRLASREKDCLAVQSAYQHDMAALHGQLQQQTAELEALRQVHQASQSSHQQERDQLQQRLEEQRSTLEAELQDVRREYQLIDQRCQQTLDELEIYFLSGRENELLLEARSSELQQLRRDFHSSQSVQQYELTTLRQLLDTQSIEFEQQLHRRETEFHQSQHADQSAHQRELEALRETMKSQRAGLEADLEQAHQSSEQLAQMLQRVQEELEHYYLQARAGRQLVESQQQELIRAQRIMSRLHPSSAMAETRRGPVEVEVLPAMELGSSQPSLQAEALLKAYADNLKRAGVLLERLGRP